MLKDLGNQKNIEREAVVAAVKALQSKGWDINPYTIADELRVPRSLLYRSAEAMDIITQARSDAGRPVDVASEQVLKRAAELEVKCREMEVTLAQLAAENEELVRRAQEGWQLGYQAALAESPKARAAHAGRPEMPPEPEAQAGGFGQTLQNFRIQPEINQTQPEAEEPFVPGLEETASTTFDPRYDWGSMESANQQQEASSTADPMLPPYNFETMETPQASAAPEETIESPPAESPHVFGDDPFASVINRPESEDSFAFWPGGLPQEGEQAHTQEPQAAEDQALLSEEMKPARTSAEETEASAPGSSDEQDAEAEEESIDPEKLEDLVKRRYQKAGEEAQEPKGLGSKFAQAARSAEGSHFVMRSVPPDIRKACLMLGLRPEDLSIEQVQQAWKREMTKPGTHPDVGGDTEMAVYLNTAKDVLITWLDSQSPKLGKLFGTGSHQRVQPTTPKEEESS